MFPKFNDLWRLSFERKFALDTRAIPRNVVLVYSPLPPLHGQLGERLISQALALIPGACCVPLLS